MREGHHENRDREGRARARALMGLLLCVALASCDNIDEPAPSLSLSAVPDTVEADLPTTVTLSATVTLDGNPISGAQVDFSASRGNFPGGTVGTTNSSGLATVDLDVDAGSADVDVAAVTSTTDGQAADSLTIEVDDGRGGGR